jgi:hypothetical protein
MNQHGSWIDRMISAVCCAGANQLLARQSMQDQTRVSEYLELNFERLTGWSQSCRAVKPYLGVLEHTVFQAIKDRLRNTRTLISRFLSSISATIPRILD